MNKLETNAWRSFALFVGVAVLFLLAAKLLRPVLPGNPMDFLLVGAGFAAGTLLTRRTLGPAIGLTWLVWAAIDTLAFNRPLGFELAESGLLLATGTALALAGQWVLKHKQSTRKV